MCASITRNREPTRTAGARCRIELGHILRQNRDFAHFHPKMKWRINVKKFA